MALIVGVFSGFGAVAFRGLIGVAHSFSFETLGQALSGLGGYHVLPLPALGGLVVGLLGYLVSSETKGPGVSNVIEAIALQGGRIPPIIIAAKPIATSITLGSGGSAGREGPIVFMGSAIGSALSQVAQLSEKRTKNLVACGAAAGIAATFNAPLAGVMFAMEVLLAEFGPVQFTSVVVAAVTASVVGHAFFGDVPAFPFPASSPGHVWELPIYVTLGVVAAFAGVGFTHTLHRLGDLFESWTFPPYLKPAAGGLLVGVIGLRFPQVFGVGYDSIEAVLFNRLTTGSIVLLGLLKIVATVLTVGSGGSGGIFAPCLFIGAMLGGLFGRMVQHAAPTSSPSSAYALVGMSAVFGAASHAPITAIFTLFEMTHDYDAILPLMLSTVVSVTVARYLLDHSVYSFRLGRRGIDVRAGRDLNLMSRILVGEAMTPIAKAATVGQDTPLTELTRISEDTHQHGLAVVSEGDRLQGVVTLSDVEQARPQQLPDGRVGDIYSSNVVTVFPDETLEGALGHFGALDIGRVPVVDRADPDRVVGMLRRGDIVRAYAHAHVSQQARLARLEQERLERRTGEQVVEIRMRGGDWAVGMTVQQLGLPPQSLIASIRRGGHELIPRGNTTIRSGDVVVALVPEGRGESLQTRLTQGP
ncbi:MAG: chloride channel protein [Anaerolineae bacterium]|jgi:CIC family chloride channel protein